MATSAQTLTTIIETLATKYNFDKDKAIEHLAKQELLPKKMLPKNAKKEVTLFASKKAEELASQHGIVPEGPGSAKDGKWSLADVQKAMEKPSKTKMMVSPNALNLANEKGLTLVGRKGTGKEGRILLKDVEKWLAEDDMSDDEDNFEISPRARQEATELDISNEELATIEGSGNEGRIVLKDVKEFHKSRSASEKSASDDED
jgi:pyruvate/2-oxoglutarate dehydrogenase complex dihydrolipoamide acyltransferase (E2) component